MSEEILYGLARAVMDEDEAAEALDALMGFCYLIHSPEQGCFKVGISGDPEQRLQQLQHANPDPLYMVGMVAEKDHRAGVEESTLEQHIHRRLAPYHRRGEWFEDTPASRALLANWFPGVNNGE